MVTEPVPGRPDPPGLPLPEHLPSFATPPGEPIPDSFSFDRPRDPQWYKRAVFYEVLIRGFHDSNGDGTGDLRGLTSRLDYLQWLGVDCIWLLPIYASPLRDGGYDISGFHFRFAGFSAISGTLWNSWMARTNAACASSPTW